MTLRTHGITTVVSLTCRTPDVRWPRQTLSRSTCRCVTGHRNDQDALVETVTELRAALDRREAVLVHCSAGASRSPAVTATALALHDDRSLEHAFE